MPVTPEAVQNAVSACLPQAVDFLSKLIAIPSLSAEEMQAMSFAEGAFKQTADVERIELSNALKDDKDYSDPITGIDYEDRHNLRVVLGGSGDGKNLLLNTHIDTVPPSEGQIDPFVPQMQEGKIFGRGSCDAKGQIATIYLTLLALKQLNAKLQGDVIAHIVVEEENGGNGTLAMTRRGEEAGGCVVLEPTDLKILTSIRGAVWFRITIKGTPGHSGASKPAQSALKSAIRVVEILENYHAHLLAESRGDTLFDAYPNPMPLTIGQLHAGSWPATAPGEATLTGVLGLLPNKTASEVMEEINAAITREGGPEIAENVDVHFTYRHDSSVVPVDHDFVTDIKEAAAQSGLDTCIGAMPASCDAWFYNNGLEIPTVVFGGGTLGVAHSNREQMPINELESAARTLTRLALSWCGETTACVR